jgi:hypothetical protein
MFFYRIIILYMKTFFKILILAFLIFIFIGIVQSCKEKNVLKKAKTQESIQITPVQYNDTIISFQERVIRKVVDFSQTFQNLSPAQKESKINSIVDEINYSIESLQKIGDFFGNSRLRDQCINWMNFYKSAFENEYKEIIKFSSKPPNEITDKDIIRMDDLQKSVAKKELEVHKKFADVQQEFYQQFGLKGKENKLDKDVSKIGKKK